VTQVQEKSRQQSKNERAQISDSEIPELPFQIFKEVKKTTLKRSIAEL
jgi:hypothetical protein